MTTYPDDVVEKALAAWCDHHGRIKPEERMRRALAAAEAAMWEHKQRTCKHPHLSVTGYMGSTGASLSDHYCPDCKAHWQQQFPLPTPPAASTGRG